MNRVVSGPVETPRVDTGSLRTKIGLLTNHMKGNDFFDVEQ
jgi:hypothetical protein